MIGRAIAVVVALAVLTAAGGAALGPGGRAKQTVTLLASKGPRPAGEPGAEAVAQRFVAAELEKLGYRVVLQRVDLPNGRSTRNVVGLTSGRPKVVIVAHLDGVRGSPAANDNASGVAVLLELAASLRGEPGVLVAATGAEERVVTGSRGAPRLAAAAARDLAAGQARRSTRRRARHGGRRDAPARARARAAAEPKREAAAGRGRQHVSPRRRRLRPRRAHEERACPRRGSSGEPTRAGTSRATSRAAWTRASWRRRFASRCDAAFLALKS